MNKKIDVYISVNTYYEMKKKYGDDENILKQFMVSSEQAKNINIVLESNLPDNCMTIKYYLYEEDRYE